MSHETIVASGDSGRRERLRRGMQLAVIAVCAFALAAAVGRFQNSRDEAPAVAGGGMQPIGERSGMAAFQVSESMDKLTERLAAKLERNPGDGDGWALLGRAYVELGQHEKSVAAFARAVALLKNDQQLKADYAEARRRLNGGAAAPPGGLTGSIQRFAPEASASR